MLPQVKGDLFNIRSCMGRAVLHGRDISVTHVTKMLQVKRKQTPKR